MQVEAFVRMNGEEVTEMLDIPDDQLQAAGDSEDAREQVIADHVDTWAAGVTEWGYRAAAVLVMVLGLSMNASAAIITLGSWTPTTPASEAGGQPWDNPSWDGPLKNLGYVVDLSNMEWLHAPFIMPDVELGEEHIIETALPGGFLTVNADGVLVYNNTIGGIFTSNGAGWENFWVLRSLDGKRGLLGIEDLPQGFGSTDNDTDKFRYWVLKEPPNQRSVPEPATLSLFGLSLLAGAARFRRKRHAG